ncbi:MAG: glycerol-3-phosphate 1-O-acyltransferase PlsY [Candidatus Binataceae bacterium]
MFSFALLLAVSYLVGSIPFGVIVGRLRGFDPRAVGSGNIGMTNVARAGGTSAAALTFVGDVLKGAAPIILARAIGFPPTDLAWVALAAFVGSICSVFLHFSGGKGVSAALGVWLVLAPFALLFAMAAFAVVVAVFQIMSLASIAAALILPPAVAATGAPRAYVMLSIVISVLVLVRHRENIHRLLRREEPKFRGRERKEHANKSAS